MNNLPAVNIGQTSGNPLRRLPKDLQIGDFRPGKRRTLHIFQHQDNSALILKMIQGADHRVGIYTLQQLVFLPRRVQGLLRVPLRFSSTLR